MDKVIAIFILVFVTSAQASEWVPLRDYNLYQLYSGEVSRALGLTAKAEVTGTAGLSWPDGSQATITYLEFQRDDKRWLYKCVEKWSSDLQLLEEECFELRR